MDTAPTLFMESLLDLEKPEGTKVCFHPNSLIYDSRNLLSLMAIEEGYDRVFWLDSDMILSQGALTQLSHDMDVLGHDMITGLYFKRRFPTAPVILDELEEPEVIDGKPVRHIHEYMNWHNAIFPVKGCGFGCVLTSTKLLKQVWDTYSNAFLPFPWAGEDYSFCHRVNLLGKQIYCDGSVRCGHVGQMVYTEQLFRAPGGDNH